MKFSSLTRFFRLERSVYVDIKYTIIITNKKDIKFRLSLISVLTMKSNITIKAFSINNYIIILFRVSFVSVF